MLPRRRETISDYAHHVLGEGDDLHMTDSFEAREENSSIIGNASCAISMASPKATSVRTKKPPLVQDVTVKMIDSLSSSEEDDQDAEQDANQPEPAKRKPLKVINEFFHKIRDNNRLLAWKIRKPNVNVPVLRPPPSLNSIREYQEMGEEEEEATVAADSITIMTLRSSRKNVGTGRTMLVRQNAQVFGRPSQAETKWDISSSLSSSGSSSHSRSLHRQRSVTLDNASCSGLSDITEDTAFHRINRADPSLFRRHVVFARPAQAHFGDTFCIDEAGESDSDGDVDESSESRAASRYDFRQLQVIDESDPWNLYAASDLHDEFVSPRQRVFSDSDVVFELHRQHRWSDFDGPTPSPSSVSVSSRIPSSSDNSSSTGEQNRDATKRYNRKSLDSAVMMRHNPPGAEQRLRTHSDSFVPEAMSFSSHSRSFWGGAIKEQEGKVTSDGDNSSNSFPFAFEERDDIGEPRSRAFSDTFRKSIEHSQPEAARHRTGSLEEERSSALKEEFNASFESQARRLSSALLNQRHQTAQQTNSASDESLFTAITTSSSSGQSSDIAHTGAPSNADNKTEPLLDQLSSPRTLTAASAIVDALRPSPAAPPMPLPTPPSSTALGNEEYYWGDGIADDEVLWPSVSSVDSLEDLF